MIEPKDMKVKSEINIIFFKAEGIYFGFFNFIA